MAVNWALAQQGQFNPMQVLQAAGMAQQQRAQQAQLAQQEAQMAQRQGIAQAAAGGDYRGAQQQALAAGDFDLAKSIGGLESTQRDQLKAEAEAIGRLAYGLRQIQNPQERAAAFQASIPAMRQQGFSEDEIQAAAQDLSDGVLDGYVRLASDIQQQFQRSQPDYQVIPEGGSLVDTRNPQALQQFSPGGGGQASPDLEAMAAQAIAAGADPAAVRARMQQMQQGGGQMVRPSGGFLPGQ